jgi:outer membrane receptor protein involved in Fe transport
MAPIYITGSAIPTTDTEGSAPVVVIDSATIEKRGYQTVEDILKNTPANGSFSNPGQTSGNFAAGAAYASLRGLGPQATLVLVNGRRVADYAAAANGQYAFVDLNNIPAQIVDRVEVLTDGTAIYGSDAVAGVINIITKKNLGSENGEVDAYIGNTDSYDAFEQRYTVMGNLASFDKNGYGVIEADYEHQNSIFAPDRQVSRSANQIPNGGADLRSGRTYPGIFQGETSGNLFSILPVAGNQPLTGTTSGVDPNVDDGANALQAYDYNPATSIIPDTTHYGMYMNYTYKFYDGNVTPNIDFSYRHNRTVLTQAAGGYSFFDGDTGPAADNLGGGPAGNPNGNIGFGSPVFTVPTTNPYNQTGEVIDILSYRNLPLGPRIEDVNSEVFRVVPSIDLKLGEGWTLNMALNYSYTFLFDKNVNFPSATGFQNALNGTTLATAFNPFTSDGAAQPQTVLNELTANSGNRDTSSLIAEDFRFNGKLFDLPAGPVQVAFGGEYRIERYTTNYTEDDLNGNVLASSVQLDTAASQKDLSGYTEVSIPVTSPSFNVPGVYKFDVDVAGRVDKYSQFGSTENPQVRFRWEIVPGLIARGGFATEFRAPSLNELAAGGNQAFTTVSDPVTGTAPEVLVNSPGNPNLKPETAQTFSGGFAYQPDFIKGLELTADYFHIRYEGQITQTNAQDLIDEGSPLVTRNALGNITSVTATYINLPGATEVDGLDFGIHYVYGDPYTSWGQIGFNLNSSLLLNYLTPGTDPNSGMSVQVENVGTDSQGLGPISRYKQDVSITYDYQGFEFVVSNDFQSGYRDSYGLDANFNPVERGVADYTTFDLQTSYQFDKQQFSKWAPGPKGSGFDWRTIVDGTRVAVGVNNVWDTQPPFTASEFSPLGYNDEYADPTGRFIYAEITKKF